MCEFILTSWQCGLCLMSLLYIPVIQLQAIDVVSNKKTKTLNISDNRAFLITTLLVNSPHIKLIN